ncbi:type VII secretion protein EccCa [Micromonospora sp. NBC_01813]|uniref:type VII secretion protein EccCa n=1 Tax=Micromonospora sp. NBC_01813 TaxID=2975988 RepID=UPI002DD9AB5D|nr:type VII secretion protein EccCa [Micromonospora sp. NBC_01813]WSA06275.1 type VII secretion protein EccCa [Micromonospora sp. NBC_01813]
MATVVVRRPSRRPAPEMPAGELVLEAPPEIPAPPARQWTQALMVVPMVAIMGAMIIPGVSGGTLGSLRFVVMGMFGVGMLAMVGVAFINGAGPSKREMAQARRRYLRGLAQQRIRVTRTAHRQRATLTYLYPDPQLLWSLVAGRRLWERRRDDPDFGVVRVGVGRQSLATALIPPDTRPMEELEPLSALALRRFVTTYSALPDLPLAMAVNGFSRVYLRGDRDRGTGLVRAMIAQLATFHPPDDLRVAVCTAADRRPEWEWLKWLPHAMHPDRTDALGPVRLVTPAITTLEALLEDLLGSRPRFDPDHGGQLVPGPHLVVVLDGGTSTGSDHLMSDGSIEGVTLIDLTTAPPRALERSALVLEVDGDGRLTSLSVDGVTEIGRADDASPATCEGLARQLAPLRLTRGGPGEQPLNVELGLADLLDLGDPYAFEPDVTWVQRPSRDRLRVRLGLRADGTPIELDLKESAQGGMGPHGLLIGATGSGKSELLRTLVLALAVTHPPNVLNFALIDFKGGATFAKLDRLPHTSAVITNLEDELPLVDRMADAINGELLRRQELLRAAGNFSSLRDYERARAAGAPLAEVPTLVVVCDEFSELLSRRPDFIDTFVQIGRVGRSLGVHLLLASQRLEEGRLRGLDTHLSYRIGLRTLSDMDSRATLGAPDAASLPTAPGHGYLRFGADPLTRFRAAYVSGVHSPMVASPTLLDSDEPLGLADYSTWYVAPTVEQEKSPVAPAEDPDAVGESLLDILVDRLAGRGTPAHRVWLPPLAEPVTLGGLLGGVIVDPAGGLRAARPELNGRLRAVVGIVDRPLEQRRDPLVLDMSGAAGHVLVIGAPRSGKSTALRTLVASLALTHSPTEVQFYCLDFGGGALGAVRGLPHVASVAGRQNTDAVRRTIGEVTTLLTDRERRFAEHDVDGMAAYRNLRRAGAFADDPHGDVFLVVDGWLTLRKEFDGLEDVLTGIATRGLAYGVHVVVGCSRPVDLRPNLRDLFGSKIELRLGDPIDSMVDRASALRVPENSPGRGVCATKHQILMALPCLDAVPPAEEVSAGMAGLVDAVATAWPGARAPEMRMLPTELPYDTLVPRDDAGTLRLTVGLVDSDLGPARLDFGADPHLLVLGDAESGKTGLLRLLARRLVDTYEPRQARIIVVDYRRGLLGEIPPGHLLGFGADQASTASLVAETVRAMTNRLPGPQVTPVELRNRSWWQGPELFVLVDDYDLVATPAANPLLPLMPLLAQGRDIGLHVVLTRRTGGAGRAMYEQFFTRMRDVGSPGLLLAGDKAEGPLLGGLKPEPLPPGRGRLISRRGGPTLVQLAWLPPTE